MTTGQYSSSILQICEFDVLYLAFFFFFKLFTPHPYIVAIVVVFGCFLAGWEVTDCFIMLQSAA